MDRLHYPEMGNDRARGGARLNRHGGDTLETIQVRSNGIPGYIGAVVLDNAVLMGNADISLDGENLSSPVVGRLRVGASSRLTVQTGGEVTLAVQPHPDLAIRAVAASNTAPVRVQFDATAKDTSSTQFKNIEVHETAGFAEKRVKLEMVVTSTGGRVNIASMPAAPLAR